MQTHATTELLPKETPELIPLQLWSPNSPDLNLTECKWRCTKHASLIWSYQQRHWQMIAAMTIWSSLAHSILKSSFQFVEITYAYFLHLLLQ